jgi:hypothetical protein
MSEEKIKDDHCDWCRRKESEGAVLHWFGQTSRRICQSTSCQEGMQADFDEFCAEMDEEDN